MYEYIDRNMPVKMLIIFFVQLIKKNNNFCYFFKNLNQLMEDFLIKVNNGSNWPF